MSKVFQSIKFVQLRPTAIYFATFRKNRYSHSKMKQVKGKEIIDYLKKSFDFKTWEKNIGKQTPTKLLKDFLDFCEDSNGDDSDYIEIFKA